MTDQRWQEIKAITKKNFPVFTEKTEPLFLKTGLTEDSQKEIGHKEILIFSGPKGKTKLEYLVKPVVLEKKEHYSHRAGTQSRTEYILSDKEFVRKLQAYQWSEKDNAWETIDQENVGQ